MLQCPPQGLRHCHPPPLRRQRVSPPRIVGRLHGATRVAAQQPQVDAWLPCNSNVGKRTLANPRLRKGPAPQGDRLAHTHDVAVLPLPASPQQTKLRNSIRQPGLHFDVMVAGHGDDLSVLFHESGTRHRLTSGRLRRNRPPAPPDRRPAGQPWRLRAWLFQSPSPSAGRVEFPCALDECLRQAEGARPNACRRRRESSSWCLQPKPPWLSVSRPPSHWRTALRQGMRLLGHAERLASGEVGIAEGIAERIGPIRQVAVRRR